MNSRELKTQENRNHSAANWNAQNHRESENVFQFLDNRPETITNRKLQAMANMSPQSNHSKSMQNIASISSKDKNRFGEIVQLFPTRRYFDSIKEPHDIHGRGKKTMPYVFTSDTIPNGIPDDSIGDDGFSTFEPGKSGQRNSQPYVVEFEVHDGAKAAENPDKQGVVLGFYPYYGHQSFNIADGHWSLNKSPNQLEQSGSVGDFKKYSEANIKINDEYSGTRKRQDPETEEFK